MNRYYWLAAFVLVYCVATSVNGKILAAALSRLLGS